MKKIVYLLLLLLPFCASSTPLKPAQELKKQLQLDYQSLIDEVTGLNDLNQKENSTWQERQTQFFKARIAYKRCELFLAYLDRDYVKNYINGAPLPQVEKKHPDL
jgi:GGDEF domain-containing protein